MFNFISHSFAALTREISSWTFKEKFHIYAHPCIIRYITHDGYADENSRIALSNDLVFNNTAYKSFIYLHSIPVNVAIQLRVWAPTAMPFEVHASLSGKASTKKKYVKKMKVENKN